jgi:enoyl-CoA hydratase/carnithine racemase
LNSVSEHYLLESRDTCSILHLISADQMNRLTAARVLSLTAVLEELSAEAACGGSSQHLARKPLIIAGNDRYFSVGADLNEIAQLSGATAFDFAKMGQRLMSTIDNFPACVYAAISGYCTQRLPPVVGRTRALQMFTIAEKLTAAEVLRIGLVSEIVPDPLARAIQLSDNENARRAGC